MTADIEARFVEMVREFPVRTGLFTFGPLLFGLLQLVNSYVHGASVLYTGFFAALMLAFAVQVTRYHLVSFRVSKLDPWRAGD